MNLQKIAALVLKLVGIIAIMDAWFSFYSESILELYYQAYYIDDGTSKGILLLTFASLLLIQCATGIALVMLANKISRYLCKTDENIKIDKPDQSSVLKTAIPLIGIYGFLIYFPYAVYTIGLWVKIKIGQPSENHYDYQELLIQYSIGLVVVYFLVFRTSTVIRLIEKFSR